MKIPGTAPVHADAPQSPPAAAVPADVVTVASLPGTSLHQVALQFYAHPR